MKKSNNYIWMPLIGFDREQADKGVSEYLNKAGFVPEGISVFIFHPDIVNQHEGMEREYQLSADCCSYFGSPRNEFRERQDWTNYDLRELAHELAARGIDGRFGGDLLQNLCTVVLVFYRLQKKNTHQKSRKEQNSNPQQYSCTPNRFGMKIAFALTFTNCFFLFHFAAPFPLFLQEKRGCSPRFPMLFYIMKRDAKL